MREYSSERLESNLLLQVDNSGNDNDQPPSTNTKLEVRSRTQKKECSQGCQGSLGFQHQHTTKQRRSKRRTMGHVLLSS